MINRIVRLCKGWVNYLISFKQHRNSLIWVFGEWFGNRCGDNCTYFANYVADKSEKLKLYWICHRKTDISLLSPKIKIVEIGTKEAERVLNNAGAIFLNQNFLDVSLNPFNRYGGAISVNFWHGFPWKKIGHDAYKNGGRLFRFYCKLLNPIEKSKKYITISELYSQKIKTAFGVKKKQLIKSGLPRNSVFYLEDEIIRCRDAICKKVLGICPWVEVDKVKIISYMPTFRDAGDVCVDLNRYFDDDFLDFLRINNIVIIQKAHFADINIGSVSVDNKTNVINFNDINATTLMCASDILISDYSSCIFDFLLLNRPIIHFTYDYEKYRTKDRGVYFDIEEIKCGVVVSNKISLQTVIRDIIAGNDSMVEIRKKRRKELLTFEKIDSCEHIYNEICNLLGIIT